MKLLKAILALSICVIILTMAGCDKEENEYELYKWCWQLSQLHPDGFTVNILSRETPTEGILVAYKETQNSFGRKGLKRCINFAKTHTGLLGGWYNEDNGQYYFDADTLFQESMMDEALLWASNNEQLSVFVLSTEEVVKIN